MKKTKLVSKHGGRSKAKRNYVDEISQEFATNVRKKLGNRVKEIILFGSRARGDFYEGSDYDILIVLHKREKDFQEMVLDESVEIMNKYYALIGFIVCDEKEWERKKRFPIGLNIIKEGVEL
ncbi:MAG: nucleotidyltransferase domain-containing protein [Candidatus Brocadiaceae bacterium]